MPSPELRSDMKRREFITLLGGAAAAWPIATRRSSTRYQSSGFWVPSLLPVGKPGWKHYGRLRDLANVEGKNIVIEFRWAEGNYDRLVDLAGELICLKVDVLVTHGTPGVLAAKQATSTIPIVMAVVGDALGSGVVS